MADFIQKKKCPNCKSIFGITEITGAEFDIAVNRPHSEYLDLGTHEVVVLKEDCGCSKGPSGGKVWHTAD